MRLRTELSDAEIAEGFHPQTDLFQRKDLALRLTGLFDTLEHGSVSLLDGRWGTGKSTFVKQWSSELKKIGIPSIYFDAFSHDYIESPFQAVAGTFVKAAIAARKNHDPAYRNFLSKAAAVGRTIASVSAKVGIKAATLGAVSAADLGELGDLEAAISDGLGDITEEGVKRLLEQQATADTQFTELRRSLEDLPKLLSHTEESSKSPPLIVFIDELDRCKPDFALGVVEVLKHFFRADGIHFVLVTNRDFLEFSVTHRYGVHKGASEYLEKFYDFVIFFEPVYSKHDPVSATRFLNKALSSLVPSNTRDGSDALEYAGLFSNAYRLSLRQMQSFATNVGLSFIAMRNNELRPTILVCLLAFLKLYHPGSFKKAKSGTLTWLEIKSILDEGDWENEEGERIAMVARYHIDPDLNENDPEWRGWGNSLFHYNIRRHKVVQYLANSIIDRFGAPTERRGATEAG